VIDRDLEWAVVPHSSLSRNEGVPGSSPGVGFRSALDDEEPRRIPRKGEYPPSSDLGGVFHMRRWVFTALLLALAMLTFPLAAGAGWGNSPYDKSDCTYTKETNFLFCEKTFSVETVTTEQIGITDGSCPSGTRLFRRTGILVESTRVFDGFDGPAPNANRNVLGDDVPQVFWKDFTDTEIGCL
jgi:hypothetical protein